MKSYEGHKMGTCRASEATAPQPKKEAKEQGSKPKEGLRTSLKTKGMRRLG